MMSLCDLDLTFDVTIVTLIFKICLGNISETIKCRWLMRGRTLLRGCLCDRSCCNLDLSFDLVIVTVSFKILSRLFLGFRKL